MRSTDMSTHPKRYEKDPADYGAVLTDVAGLIENARLGRPGSQRIDDRALLADWGRIVEHDGRRWPHFISIVRLCICILTVDMNAAADDRLLRTLAAAQRGVFSKADLQTALGERHPAAFARRIRALGEVGALRRFMRGWYVAGEFDLATLSQRIAPRSYISFGTALARELLVGSAPERQVMAAKVGVARRYSGLGVEIVHLGIAPHLVFGHQSIDGVAWTDAEKAVLDVLYFHLRGRRYVFDIYSDIAFEKLDRDRFGAYLKSYRNLRFVAFAKGLVEGA